MFVRTVVMAEEHVVFSLSHTKESSSTTVQNKTMLTPAISGVLLLLILTGTKREDSASLKMVRINNEDLYLN